MGEAGGAGEAGRGRVLDSEVCRRREGQIWQTVSGVGAKGSMYRRESIDANKPRRRALRNVTGLYTREELVELTAIENCCLAIESKWAQGEEKALLSFIG